MVADDSADPAVTLGNAGSGAALRAAGNNIGVEAVGQTGVSAVGNAIGVAATGLMAIRGEGGIGVHGEGAIGVRGHSATGDGVVGESEGGATTAAVGVVPVKVSTENGAIRPGDLLVTSTTAGHAMRAGPNPPVGTVIGKAFEKLDQGTGVIKMLATLQ